jgi:DNA-binding MarR family transcriptional regulator
LADAGLTHCENIVNGARRPRPRDVARQTLVAAGQFSESRARVAKIDAAAYVHRERGFGEDQMDLGTNKPPPFTPRQGQFLAFIHAYTLVNRRPPSEADLTRFFQITPPSAHQMVLNLEKAGLIARQPRTPRSIVVLVERSALPELEPARAPPPYEVYGK